MIQKEILEEYLKQGISLRGIGRITGYNHRTLGYWAKKYQLTHLIKPNHIKYKDEHYFQKINTKEKAYILGFILGDGYIGDEVVQITVGLKDREVLDFIANELGARIVIDKRINKKQKKYPSAEINIGNKRIVQDILKLSGGKLKQDRHIPIISPKLENYLVQGFFDAEGTITWGHRKDRNRIWHKVAFISQLKMLKGIQNILIKNGIPTKIRPKSDSNCYVMEIANKEMVLKLMEYIYQDKEFIILKRKYQNYQALRLELGEVGGA